LAAQLGRVSLPELMQEAADLAECHLIRNALQKSRGHVGSAADWLGITAESLALRMQRHGLGGRGPVRTFASMLN
jgi:DNA-binding NtrC family response regulator